MSKARQLQNLLDMGGRDRMLHFYLEVALFSSLNPRGDKGETLISNYNIKDIAKSSLAIAKKDLKKFKKEAGDILNRYDAGNVGHDFWLTRVGSGGESWFDSYDQVKGDGFTLTRIAKKFTDLTPYIGDDNKVHFE
jgi:hypothetical protein|tara:strand:+ start:388 stop:795 length:408 start_codon:yes stop_codon:yes gene_type:complete